MRLAWPLPWHFVVSVLISVSALVLANLSPQLYKEESQILALFLVILLPGYLLVLSLFPSRTDITLQRRVLLSLFFAVSLSILAGLILIFTPRGLQIASLATVLALQTLFLAAVSYARLSALPQRNRFHIRSKRGLRSRKTMVRTSRARNNGRSLSIFAVLLAVCLFAAIAINFNMNPTNSSEDGFTEFQVSWPNKIIDSQTVSMQTGSEVAANAKIVNRESGPRNYTMRLMFNKDIIFSKDLYLRQNDTWQGLASGIINGPAGKHRLEILLFKELNYTLPYKEAFLWINLSNNTESSNQSEILNSSNLDISTTIPPAITEKESKVAVLSVSNKVSKRASTSDAEQLPEAKTNSVQEISAEANTKISKDDASARDNQPDSQIEIRETKQTQNQAPPSSSVSPSSTMSIATDNTTHSAGSISASNDQSSENETFAPIEPQMPNSPPFLTELYAMKPNPQIVGTPILWMANASDADDDQIRYRFFLNDQPVTVWSKFNFWNWRTAGLLPGDYRITVLAQDGSHASEKSFDSSRNATFTLISPDQSPVSTSLSSNQPPILNKLQPNKLSPEKQGEIIFWEADASDPDGDRIQYRFLVNGQVSRNWSKSDSWNWFTNDLSAGEYQIMVQARDGNHASADSFDSFLIAPFSLNSPSLRAASAPLSAPVATNQPPVLISLNPDLSSPQIQGTVVLWKADARDSDNDKILYKFLQNDRDVTEWSSSNTWEWNTSSAIPGDYVIKVLVRDGTHASQDSFDGFLSAAFTMNSPILKTTSVPLSAPVDTNQLPVLISLNPDLSSPQVQGTVVLWKADARDSDGDKVKYKFLLNGRAVNRWSESDTWKWSTNDLPAGDYRMSVMIRDGNHASEESSDASLDRTFTIVTEIDQQIDQLMKQRKSETAGGQGYQSKDIQISKDIGAKPRMVLGTSKIEPKQETKNAPQKLG